MTDLSREQDIKVALIDWLYNKGLLDDATIINEMVVANWSRRADLAVANGHLQAFEIKSDFDTLKRLDGQLEIFTSRFEKVTVVCSKKFTYEVSKKVKSEVGIIEFQKKDGCIKFKVIQRGRISSISNKKVLIGFLLKKEVFELLKCNNIKFSADFSKKVIEEIALNISYSKIRDFVISCIKARYKETSDLYLSKLNDKQETTTQDLDLLSKKKQRKDALNIFSFKNVIVPENDTSRYYEVDVLSFVDKYGEFGEEVPQRVLKRVIR